MKLDITSFCFWSGSMGFGFQQVNVIKQYWKNDEHLNYFKDTDFVHCNEINYYFELLQKLLINKKIKFGTLTVGEFSYFIISSEEASKYILSTLNKL